MKNLQINKLFPACVMALSGVIAFFIYSHFQWRDGYWAIISIAAVTQQTFLAMYHKTVLRIFGTLLGASVAYYFVLFSPTLWLTPIFFSGLFLCLLLSLAATKYRYLMIVAGITFTLVISSGFTNGIEAMAITRTYEVIFGCSVCLIVAVILNFIFKNSTGKQTSIAFKFTFQKSVFLEALILTIACGFTFMTWQWFQYPLGFWGTISCLFVIEENTEKSFHNATKRILAHFYILVFAAAIALYIPKTNPWVLLPLTVGLFFSGYTFSMKTKWLQSLGNTMGIGLACMLLTNQTGMTQENIVMWRFINIVYGVTIAFTTIYIIDRWLPVKNAS